MADYELAIEDQYYNDAAETALDDINQDCNTDIELLTSNPINIGEIV